MTIEMFTLAIAPLPKDGDAEANLLARVMPFGEVITYSGRRITFDPGSITLGDDLVPLTVDHGEGVTERIGKLTRAADSGDGLYAELAISDTRLGADVRRLLIDGVLTDVSAGIEIDPEAEFTSDDGVLHRFGRLDHVAIVARGAFSDAGARVLAVHTATTKGEPTVAATDPAKTEAKTEAVEMMEKFTAQISSLEKEIATLALPSKDPAPFWNGPADYMITLAEAAQGGDEARKRLAEFQLSDDTTTTAAGVVPDFQSSEVLSIVDTDRPYLGTIPRDPIGSSGMTINYPTVTQKPDVDVQALEKTLVATQTTTIGVTTLDLLTYAGASDVSRQLVDRSQPSFTEILMRELAGQYAESTDGDAADDAVTSAVNSVIVADLSADPAATYAAVAQANQNALLNVRRPATHWAMSATRWSEFIAMVDSDGRPIVVWPANGPSNAQGLGGFASMSAQYGGLTAFVDPNLATDTSVVYNADRYAGFVEQTPLRMEAVVVELLGLNLGIFGLFAHLVKYPNGGTSINAS